MRCRLRLFQTPVAHACSQGFSHFHASAGTHEEARVVVPSMGDSITEGTVAGVEKQPGEPLCLSQSAV